MNPIRRSPRRGMTFLEIVVATAMMGVVSAAIFGVFGFLTNEQWREQRKLDATEVANRLVLQYLDNPTGMPDSRKTLEYPLGSGNKYRWEYSEDQVRLDEVAPEQRDQQRQSPLSPDRFMQVTVRVWLSEDSGGARTPDVSTPAATLTRMLDPVYPRNPDSYMGQLNNPTDFRRIMEAMTGFNAGGAMVTTGGGLQGRGPRGPQNGPQGGTRPQRGEQGTVRPGDAFGRGRQQASQRGGPQGGRFGGQGGPGGGLFGRPFGPGGTNGATTNSRGGR